MLEKGLKMKALKFLAFVVVVFGIFWALHWWDQTSNAKAEAFAFQAKGKDYPVIAGYTEGGIGREMSIHVDSVGLSGSHVSLSGILTIDPPYAGCTLTAVSELNQNDTVLSWDCKNVLVRERLDFLSLKDNPSWFTVWLNPTGVRKP